MKKELYRILAEAVFVGEGLVNLNEESIADANRRFHDMEAMGGLISEADSPDSEQIRSLLKANQFETDPAAYFESYKKTVRGENLTPYTVNDFTSMKTFKV
jgi:hypothetical protein